MIYLYNEEEITDDEYKMVNAWLIVRVIIHLTGRNGGMWRALFSNAGSEKIILMRLWTQIKTANDVYKCDEPKMVHDAYQADYLPGNNSRHFR